MTIGKPRLVVLLILFTIGLQPIFGEPSTQSTPMVQNPLEYLRDKALTVSIVTRVVGRDRVNIWKTESERITVSGKSVNVTLSGDDLEVKAQIIPFLHEDGTILLVAKGEVWEKGKSSDDTEYYTTMRSLPVKPGESIIFFPVGVAVDSEEQIYTIEMEIQVQPYN